jgi:HD-like signal output (HDOD) protein
MSDIDSSKATGRGANLQMPPLPRVLPKVLGPLHESGFTDQEAVFAAIDCEPDLADRILNHLNVQLRRPVSEVERAVQMVGPTTAAGLIIGLSLQKWRALRDGPAGSCLLRLIYHSEATAALTQKLLRRHPGRDPESSDNDPEAPPRGEGFAKGFVHDLGKLILLYNYPEKAATLYGPKRTDRGYENTDARVVEQAVFGCDHTDAGAQAAAALDLPDSLATVAGHHYDGEAHDSEARTETVERDLRAVRAANLLTKTAGSDISGLDANKATVDWDTCADDPVWLDWAEDPNSAPEFLDEDLTNGIVLYTRFFLDLPDVQSLAQIDE